MSLAVVTDSAACLPPQLAAEHGITVVELPTDGTTTSRPAVDELTHAYADALDRSDEVLAVHISSALSGTVDNARTAAQILGDSSTPDGHSRLTVLDSLSSGAGLGFAAIAATHADDARRGAALARESAARSTVLLLAADLGALSRGGRLDRGTALMGGTLGIRPILHVTGDGIRVVETVRGAARARRHLLQQALHAAGLGEDRGPRPPAGPVRLAVHHADAPEEGQGLADELASLVTEAGGEVLTLLCSPADPATAVHVGAGALGIVVAPALTHR